MAALRELARGARLSRGAIAFALWSLWRYVPSKGLAFILLGISPFLVRLVPAGRLDPERLLHGLVCGAASVSFERREIVATKAVCQTLNHTAKLARRS